LGLESSKLKKKLTVSFPNWDCSALFPFPIGILLHVNMEIACYILSSINWLKKDSISQRDKAKKAQLYIGVWNSRKIPVAVLLTRTTVLVLFLLSSY